ncbi:FGGY-family carbohydrate kinase [Cohnella faecalis]|uniref:FGGY-family carbohydrate kinase n=1 Tax=Cohnella faecalis TaxID=2315694 RepID=UPI0011C22619|nr:FGGY-family carbohydrate kinase [Cohnella faecalis]
MILRVGRNRNIRESMEVFEAEGHAIRTVHLGGGGKRNAVWRRMIGDVFGKDIALLANRDASAVGAKRRKNVRTAALSLERHSVYGRIHSRYRKAYRALNEFYQEEREDAG